VSTLAVSCTSGAGTATASPPDTDAAPGQVPAAGVTQLYQLVSQGSQTQPPSQPTSLVLQAHLYRFPLMLFFRVTIARTKLRYMSWACQHQSDKDHPGVHQQWHRYVHCSDALRLRPVLSRMCLSCN
jgi:hypothetical protein